MALACLAATAATQPSTTRERISPTITDLPKSQTVMAGDSATFTVQATGTPPFRYQWTFNGSNVGSNSNSYTRYNCQLADNGGHIGVTVTDASGLPTSVTSGERMQYTLTVLPNGKQYYVAPTGSSGNTGRSTDSPWTVSYALANAGAGNTIVFMPGVYSSILLNNASKQTGLTLKSPTKWAAVIANGTQGILIGHAVNHVTLDGFQVRYSSDVGIKSYASNTVVRNCWVHHSTVDGIYVCGLPETLIENCLIEYNSHGVYLSGTNGILRNNVLRYNFLWGVHLYDGNAGRYIVGWKVYNNLSYRNYGGMVLWAMGDTTLTNHVFGNTICYNTNYGFVPNYGTITLTNNIIAGNAGGNAVQGGDAATTKYCDYNASTASLSSFRGPHDVVFSTPGFVNSGNGLFWLTAGSRARDAANPAVIPPVDFFGNRQAPVRDIGAFQYSAALAGDTRVLDPPPANPDYWSALVSSLAMTGQ